jgi:hypothetical protein
MPVSLNPMDILLSIVASWLAEKAKYWDEIDWITPDNTARVQKILTLFSLLVAIGQHFLGHSLASGIDWKEAAQVLVDFGVCMTSWLVAYKTGWTKKAPAK